VGPRASSQHPPHHRPIGLERSFSTVLEGRLRFVVGGEEQEVTAGESMFVPGGVPHEVEALEDSLVLDVFSPVRDDWLRGDDGYLRR